MLQDDRHDAVETQQQLRRAKDWIISHQLKTLELTDVLSNFPDIFSALTEEIMDQLEKECVLLEQGRTHTSKTETREFKFVTKRSDVKN